MGDGAESNLIYGRPLRWGQLFLTFGTKTICPDLSVWVVGSWDFSSSLNILVLTGKSQVFTS